MARPFKAGDKVTWNTPQGETQGTVQRKVTGVGRVKGHVAHATPQEPQYEVSSDRTGAHAIHRPEALRKT